MEILGEFMMSNTALILFVTSTFLVLWIYGFYPLFIFLLKPFYRPFKREVGFTPTFTVLVPSFNEEKVIEKKIQNLLSLDYPKDKYEIIVIDDGSTDRTSDIVRNYKKVILIKESRIGKSEAINRGLKKASGDIILLTDADAFFSEDSLSLVAENFADDTIGSVTAAVTQIDPQSTLIIKDFSISRLSLSYREGLLDSIPAGVGGFLAFRRNLIDALDPLCLADDVDIAIRVRKKNARVIFDPRIIVSTWDPNTVFSWYKLTVRRTLQGLTTLFRHKSVLFNPKYGWYGAMILPTRLFLHRLNPIFMIIALISSYFVNPFLTSFLIIFSVIVALIIPRVRKMFIVQISFLHALGIYLTGRYKVTWERGPRK
ncbi:glycosyl transferase [Thaumarchaeota archaeon SCGC AB-539-E09]|nr:glycosyl transferase [Thaumarchaeota archaeon SCGC AB-539-E09]